MDKLSTKESSTDTDLGTNDLITNLDHDIPEIRVRALQCLQRKLDHGLIPTHIYKRTDLLNRLACWLRSPKWTEAELVSIIQFLSQMCQYQDFCQIFMNTPLDNLLSNARQVVRADTKALIDRLLDSVRIRTFDIHCQGLPEICNESSRVPSSAMSTSREETVSISPPEINVKLKHENTISQSKEVEKEKSNAPPTLHRSSSELEVYFKNNNNNNNNNIIKNKLPAGFGISTIRLDVTDRRVLASTVESLLSRKEGLIYMTTCFVRDVLLNDFPAETFVQECSVSESLVTVVQECWDDNKINYAGFQALYKLSNLLRMRFAILDSSEFYSCQIQSQHFNSQRQKNSTLTILRTQALQVSSSTDYFLSNLCQLVKTLSHATLLKPRNIYMWILLDNFCYTLNVCVKTFNFDPNPLSVQLEEILLDLCKSIKNICNSDYMNVNPSMPAFVMSSLLNSFEDTPNLSKEIRQGIWNLASPHLYHIYPSVFQHFVETARTFEPKLEELGTTMMDACNSVGELERFLQSDVSPMVTFEQMKKMIQFLNYIPSDDSESLDKFLQKSFSICTDSIYDEVIPEIKDRVELILSFMVEKNNYIRTTIYSYLHRMVKKHFGPKSTSNKNYEDIYSISIILNKDVLEEILIFGLRDELPDVEHFAEEIILFILKSKVIVGEELWKYILKSFNPIFQVLQIHADPQTVLGRLVLTLFDPTRDEIEFSDFEIFTANLRFLFSCNSKVREEGSDRVMKVISSNSKGSSRLGYSSYSNYALSSVFNIGRSLDMADHRSRNDISSQYQVGFLLKQMKLIDSDDLDAAVRRNALQQVSIVLETIELHDEFKKNGGLESILSIISRTIDENNFKFALDLLPPATRILKLLTMQNSQVREILAENENILMDLACGLLTLRSDDIFRIDAVHLLCLILFHPYLRENGDRFSLPQFFVTRCRIPINVEVYMTISEHSQPVPEISLENIFKYWWKVRNNEDPKVLTNEFFTIQNATEHKAVVDGIEKIWENAIPLVLNKRIGMDVNLDEETLSDSMEQCKEAFSRFISVEPTSTQDEDLLGRILDLFSFFLTYLRDPIKFKEWIIPIVNQKGSALRRVLLEHCLVKEEIGTMMNTVVYSVFNFYSILEQKDGISGDMLWEMMGMFTQVIHKLSGDGFTSPAVLHSVLLTLANITADTFIIEKLNVNHEYALVLLNLLCDGLFVIGDRTNPTSFRNTGSVLYGAACVLHLILSLKTEESWEWIVKCIQLIPFLWASSDSRVKAIGFQICDVISSSSKGTILILSELESPTLLWKTAYAYLFDSEQISLVRQKAGSVVLNLITYWKEMVKVMDQDLVVPKMQILEDITKVLPNIYWHSKLSHEMKSSNDFKQQINDSPEPLFLITPKLLSNISGIIIATITTTDIKTSNSTNETVPILKEMCITLFRLLGTHPLSLKIDIQWWIDCCDTLNNIVRAITSMIQHDPKFVLLADKSTLPLLIKLLQIQGNEGDLKSNGRLSTLWISVFNLLTYLYKTAPNFENFERLTLLHQNIIFPRIIKWLTEDPFRRKVCLDFLKIFLHSCCEEGSESSQKLWNETENTHGNHLCEKLLNLVNSLDVDIRMSALISCHSLYRLAPSVKILAIERNSIDCLIKTLVDFGQKSSKLIKKKEQHEIICILHLISSTLFESEVARDMALRKDLPSALHLILKLYVTNHNLLQGIVECLVNFTNDYPKGSHALTLTTGLIGGSSRKVPTLNSLFAELLNLLHNEMENIDSSNGKIANLMFDLIKNCVFSNECRNCLVKINILSFIKRLHIADSKKWSLKNPIRLSFLKFLLDLSVHSDMQLYIAKLPESTEILILLAEADSLPSSLIATKILRNLCFHPGNRPRFINDTRLMLCIVHKLKSSEDNEEISCVAVSLWALISNSEKGKVLAKSYGCGTTLLSTIQRLRKKDEFNGKTSNEILSLLENVSHIINSSIEIS